MSKFEIWLIASKGTIKFVVGTLTPLGTALAVLADSGKPISKLAMLIAVIGAVVGGMNSLDGFLSSSFGNFLKKAGLNGASSPPPTGDTQFITKPDEPIKP